MPLSSSPATNSAKKLILCISLHKHIPKLRTNFPGQIEDNLVGKSRELSKIPNSWSISLNRWTSGGIRYCVEATVLINMEDTPKSLKGYEDLFPSINHFCNSMTDSCVIYPIVFRRFSMGKYVSVHISSIV